MAHTHNVYDTDSHFVVVPVSREIRNESGKTKLVQYDHNSERFTFELPRYIDGHDMLNSNVEVHYINISANKAEQSEDVYIVDDLAETGDTVVFSWLISANATRYAGSLAFLIRFTCLTDDVIDYAWHTAIFSDISIVAGMNNGATVVEEFSDVLEKWKEETLGTALEAAEKAEAALAEIETLTENLDVLPTVTTADNGKFLRVVNGAWVAAEIPIYGGE